MQNLPIIPSLLHAAILGLLSGSVPLKETATATTVAVPEQGDMIVEPTPVEAARARSVHVLGFTGGGELLLAESEGSFTAEEWALVLERGQARCAEGGDDDMSGGRVGEFVRATMRAKTAADLAWK